MASLVPRPRKNTTLYFGAFAANARGRKKIVRAPPRTRPRHQESSWAELMKHSFGLDVLACPKCHKRLLLVAVIHDRKEIRRLLEHLRIFSEPIPIRPARPPPDDFVESYDFT